MIGWANQELVGAVKIAILGLDCLRRHCNGTHIDARNARQAYVKPYDSLAVSSHESIVPMTNAFEIVELYCMVLRGIRTHYARHVGSNGRCSIRRSKVRHILDQLLKTEYTVYGRLG